MNTAILIISSASLICSVSTLLIMAKTARELKLAKDEVETVKAKVSHNANVVKTALGALEI